MQRMELEKVFAAVGSWMGSSQLRPMYISRSEVIRDFVCEWKRLRSPIRSGMLLCCCLLPRLCGQTPNNCNNVIGLLVHPQAKSDLRIVAEQRGKFHCFNSFDVLATHGVFFSAMAFRITPFAWTA